MPGGMNRMRHIAREIVAGIAHTASATLNTVALSGDMFTSTSARAHMETHDRDGRLRDDAKPEWLQRRRRINRLFFWQNDHCRGAWEADHRRAVLKHFANRPGRRRKGGD